jgi:hypothetical protein
MIPVNDPTGSRTASLITRYSLYLSTLPPLLSVTGVTSYMFAVEGTAANIWLLYLASRFQQDHTNANARRIFLCSLWYLPLLMAGMVFHSKRWDAVVEQKQEEGFLVSNGVQEERANMVRGIMELLVILSICVKFSSPPLPHLGLCICVCV